MLHVRFAYVLLLIINVYSTQIKQKLIAFEGGAKSSKIRSVMKWWSKCISMTIAKTASRNVAFKVARMREAILRRIRTSF